MEQVVITIVKGIADLYYCTPNVDVFIVDYDTIESGYCPVCGAQMHDLYCDICKRDWTIDDPAEFVTGGIHEQNLENRP